MITKDLGAVTAYAEAVEGGYTGTEEEYAALLASYATVAQNAAASASAAAQSATDAAGSATSAAASAAEASTTVSGAIASIEAAGDAQVDLVTAEGTTQIGLVSAEGAAQVSAVDAKGAEVIESIPEDYTELSADVTQLKSDFEQLDGVVIKGYSTVGIESGTWKDSGATKTSGANRLRTDELIHLYVGDFVTAINGSYQHIYKVWNADKSATLRSDSSYNSNDETYTASVECWVAVIYRLSDNSDLDPADFNGEVRVYNTVVSKVPQKLDKTVINTVSSSNLIVGAAGSDGAFYPGLTDTKHFYRPCGGLTSISVKTSFWKTTYPAIVFYATDGSVVSTVPTVTGAYNYGTILIPQNAVMYAVNVATGYESAIKVNEAYEVPNKLNLIDREISDIKDELNTIEGSIVLPDKMYGVEGFPSYLYYENILKNGWLKDYEISSSDIQVRLDCHVITPTEAGDTTIPVILYKGKNVVESKSLTHKVVSASASGSASVLIIGDSKSAARAPWNTLHDLLEADNNVSFTFLGTVTSGYIAREAYSGKSVVDVCDNEYITTGVPNIFYDANVTTTNGHHFSFAKGVQTLGSTPDIVFIDHGANQWSKSWSTIKGCYDDMIASIHAVDPDIMVVVVAQEGTGLLDKPTYITDGKWALDNPTYTNIEKMVNEYQGKEASNIFLQPQYLCMDLYRDFPICSLPHFDGAAGERDFCMDDMHPGLNANAWNASTSYKYGAWVDRNGNGYGCRKAHTNIDPETDTNGEYWSKCKNLGDGYKKKGMMYYYMLKYLMTVE